jgi:hypothetical protein
MMAWDVTGSSAETCSWELMRMNAFGVTCEGMIGLSTSRSAWAA